MWKHCRFYSEEGKLWILLHVFLSTILNNNIKYNTSSKVLIQGW